MPVQYGSIIDEHRTVRTKVGLFDLSHMGELYVDGPEAGPALAAALVTDPPSLTVGRAHYSMICTDDGGIIDDLIVYRLGETSFLVVANAGNAADRVGRAGRAARRRPGDPRRPVAGHRSAGGPGPGRGRGPRPADRRRPVGPPLLRGDRGDGRRHPGSRRPDRLHRRGRLRGLRRHRPDRGALGRPAAGRPGGRRWPDRARGARHAPARGGHAALRQRARPRHEPVRGRSRPGRQARQGRATSSAGPRSSGSPATDRPNASSASSSRDAGSPGTATPCGRAIGGPGS